jgi:hypothetical protein
MGGVALYPGYSTGSPTVVAERYKIMARAWLVLRGAFVAVREARLAAREGVAKTAAVLGGFAH